MKKYHSPDILKKILFAPNVLSLSGEEEFEDIWGVGVLEETEELI